ncbi:ABC transporter permease [Lyngbya sp. PCC 8106]|uniref:ABC transporter permease n=1 Tax=Lyngbya sp. (strain PCC 8106) TaxID=313612 RepID=UPI0000EAB257|nr:ABC transporter permease [Lyngbya sp. PCC 8106]EAW39209.1 spermidine/putrescine ABC transporter, permease protein [Lyngbya sp. PCC 8106]
MTLLPQNQPSPKSVETRKRTTLLILLLPTTIWLFIFFVLPLIFVLVCSFLQRGTYGGINWIFTLDNYQRLISPLYWGIFWQSLQLAALTTIVCLMIAYPLAFFIVTRPERWRNILLGLVIIPFWTNFLVRTYAWIVILGNEGVINSILQSLQLIDEPISLLFTPFAVIIGLIYGYLPFMILPLYATLERFDFSLVEAAQDLGANNFRSFLRVIFPLTRRGILAGSILVFIPAVGAFITPDILGGAKTLMVGNLIQNQFLQARNWPFGSALSMILMGVILIPILIYLQSQTND